MSCGDACRFILLGQDDHGAWHSVAAFQFTQNTMDTRCGQRAVRFIATANAPETQLESYLQCDPCLAKEVVP